MELLANPLLVLARREQLRPNIDTTTLLYLQNYRNELALEALAMLVPAGDSAALAAAAQNIAYTKGKLDLIADILSDADIDTKIISTSEEE